MPEYDDFVFHCYLPDIRPGQVNINTVVVGCARLACSVSCAGGVHRGDSLFTFFLVVWFPY